MENNFFVGIVCHKKVISNNIVRERKVLYTSDNVYYIDLIKEKEYMADNRLNEYVDESTLIPTDINDYNTDYAYLLSKYKGKRLIRRR